MDEVPIGFEQDGEGPRRVIQQTFDKFREWNLDVTENAFQLMAPRSPVSSPSTLEEAIHSNLKQSKEEPSHTSSGSSPQ